MMWGVIIACPECNRRFDVSGRAPGMEARCRCGHRFRIPEVSSEAATRSCKSCGAAVNSSATTCTYCGSPVAVQRCPRCLGLVAAGARYCQHCGENVEASAIPLQQGETKPNRCPRCTSQQLEALLFDGVAVDHCRGCGGLWLDHRVFAQLQRHEAANAPMMLRLSELPRPSSTPHAKTYIPCPECGSLMNRRNFAGCSGVIVDECRRHGVWFDAGELATIMQFIRDGGLDRARAKLEQQQNERQRLHRMGSALGQIRDRRVSAPASPGDYRNDPVTEWSLEAAAHLIGGLFFGSSN